MQIPPPARRVRDPWVFVPELFLDCSWTAPSPRFLSLFPEFPLVGCWRFPGHLSLTAMACLSGGDLLRFPAVSPPTVMASCCAPVSKGFLACNPFPLVVSFTLPYFPFSFGSLSLVLEAFLTPRGLLGCRLSKRHQGLTGCSLCPRSRLWGTDSALFPPSTGVCLLPGVLEAQ